MTLEEMRKAKHDLQNSCTKLKMVMDFLAKEDFSAFTHEELITEGSKSVETIQVIWKKVSN